MGVNAAQSKEHHSGCRRGSLAVLGSYNTVSRDVELSYPCQAGDRGERGAQTVP